MAAKKMKTDAHPKRAFISSTLEDLTAYRKAAFDAITQLKFMPIDCGYWAASANLPLDRCLQALQEADVVVCIVAERHGWTPTDQPDGQHKSITRLECEHARDVRKIDVIPFFITKAGTDPNNWETSRISAAPPDKIQEVATQVGRNVAALAEFKHWLEGSATRQLEPISSPDQLKHAVFRALGEWADTQGMGKAISSHARVRAEYLQWLQLDCASVELLGLDLKDAQNVRLGQVYVPAVTSAKAPEQEGDRDVQRLRLHEARYDLLLHRVGAESLYVSGNPGAGKSTFCRWLALLVAGGVVPVHPVAAPAGFEEQLPDTLQGRFPLLFKLRELVDHPACLAGRGTWTRARFEQALADWIAGAGYGGLTPDVFRAEIDNGRCLVIFDGADELPDAVDKDRPRRNFLSGLADALPAWHTQGHRVLLTSRPYGLSDAERRRLALTPVELAGLPGELQETFIRRWYDAANPARAVEHAEGLISHLAERRDIDDLDKLRANPMLLTALCVKYDQGQRLPSDLFRLYDAVVDQVLHKRYDTENERDVARSRLAAIALGMHRGDTRHPRVTPAAEVGLNEIDALLAAFAKSDPTTESGGIAAAKRREDLLSNSGLLLPRAAKRAGFYHLSFQEFLAAVRLQRVEKRMPAGQVLKKYAASANWRPTLKFLFCAIAENSPDDAVGEFAALLDHLTPQRLSANPNPALLLAECLQVAHGRKWNITRFAQPLRDACHHALRHLEPRDRAHLWTILSSLDLDDRPGVGLRPDGMPDIVWCDVPGGKVVLEDDAGTCAVAPFRIAKYPVTYRQYRAFLDDPHGYADAEWWHGLRREDAPGEQFHRVDHCPAERVSWYDATAYCRWLSTRLGYEVRLPSEEEWQQAATGGDLGNVYPWGSTWNAMNANASDSGINQTSVVGLFPAGGSKLGAQDMSGNVWEWCGNTYERRLAAPRVLRGGAFLDSSDGCRCAFRFGLSPGGRNDDFGFRLCCAPPIVKR